MAIIGRHGYTFPGMASPAAQALARGRVPEFEAAGLPLLRPLAWVFLHGLKSLMSSMRIRGEGAARRW